MGRTSQKKKPNLRNLLLNEGRNKTVLKKRLPKKRKSRSLRKEKNLLLSRKLLLLESSDHLLVWRRSIETLLWSGIKRGPPRREKFPDVESLMADLKKFLSSS